MNKKRKEFYRCNACGKLVGDQMIHNGICAGHLLRLTNSCTLWEWILIRLGIIK